MNTNKKVVFIVVLGVGACLLSSLLGHYFTQKTRDNQHLLFGIRQLTEKVENIRLLRRDFIQSGDPDAWKKITNHIDFFQRSLADAPPRDGQWKQYLKTLTEKIAEYDHLLSRIHDPALGLNKEKNRVQRIGLSFSTEIQDRIITPYRKEEGLKIYEGRSIDPIKTRIKETAYDLMALHIQQQLILTELFLDWDLSGYRKKKEVIAGAMEKHKAQLHYLNVLMGNEPDIDRVIGSLEKKLSELVQYEQRIVQHFSKLDFINKDLVVVGGELLNHCEAFSTVISSEISRANTLNRNLSWALLIAILCTLSVLGAILGHDIIRYVEEIKKAQGNLLESEERLKDLIGNVPGVVYQFIAEPNDLQSGIFTSIVREKIIEIFGLDAELGDFFNRFSACLPEKDRTRFRTSVKDVAETLLPWNYEGQFIRPSGETIWFEGRSLQRKIGDRIAFYGFLADITLRKENEEELHRLRSYLSNIIDSMPSLLVAVDRDGNVTQWNHRAAQATGLSPEKARFQPLTEVFPRLGDEMERIKTAIRERRVISSPKVPRKKKQETRFEDVTIFPLVANGVEGAVIRVDDVTEQVRLEEMMIQGEKMLSVGGLAAGMAHEINNPLAGMMQTAEVMGIRLGQDFDVPANRKAAEAAGTTMAAIETYMAARGIPRMLDAITASGRRVAAIVDNMLSFARKGDATISSHFLEDLLDKTTELAATDYDLKKQYDFKQIEIRREYAQNAHGVSCEGAKIQQVILNILRNGAQAMQAAGTESPRFIYRTRHEADRHMATMEIEDNGPGMDEATRKRIFEPFFTTKPIGVGTGLGLSVSYFIITENHRGEMSVESSPGTGTKFIIRLPLEGPAVEKIHS